MRNAGRCAALAAVAWLAILAAPAAAAVGDCGQPLSTGTGPKTSDALAALRTAVGSASACDAEPCVCDINASGEVNTSDALAILRVAVGQNVTLACDCGCTALGGASSLEAGGGVSRGSIQASQIELQITVIEVTELTAGEIGLDFVTNLLELLPEPGGTSGYDTNVAVSSNATGGPLDVPYLLYADHRPEGTLPILNRNFDSPFDVIKTLVQLPPIGCITFDEDALLTLQNHPGGSPVENVAPSDGGYGDAESVAYSFLTQQQVNALIANLETKNGTEVFSAPTVRLYPGQPVFHMIDDVEPDMDDFITAFRTRIADVTMMPFGTFTGPTLDLEPQISGDDTILRMRLGTQLATFFYSTAFLVDGAQTDAEIPLHQRSTTTATFLVEPGKSLLVGGLKLEGNAVVQKGLPIFGDIPLLGSSFTRKHLSAMNRAILIVTPTIVSAPEPP
jgi:Flp pilus assembly secretin CpaC